MPPSRFGFITYTKGSFAFKKVDEKCSITFKLVKDLVYENEEKEKGEERQRGRMSGVSNAWM